MGRPVSTDTNPPQAATGQQRAFPSRPGTPDEWIARAAEVAEELATDAAERDRANRVPHAELALLKDSGLVTMLGPVEQGGGGQEWPTAHRVIREVSAGDGSLGQLLGYHYVWFWTPRMYGTREQADRFEREATRGGWFLAGALNPRDSEVSVRDDGDELVFVGKKTFATGVAVSDRCFLEGVREGDGAHVLAVLPTDQPGLVPHDDWDNMGQRLTASGGVTINEARARRDDALGHVDGVFRPHVRNTMDVPTNQLAFANLYLGIAKGALARAAEYTRSRKRAWGGYARTVDEPHVLDLYGDLTAKLWAVEALADQVAEEGLPLYRDLDALTERTRGEYAVRVAAVKARATDVSLEVTNRIFEATGARSTATSFGFDLFWRNVRTHTLHDPVAYKRRELGAFVLRDEVPQPSPYS